MAIESLNGIEELFRSVFVGYAAKFIVAIIILLFGFIVGRILSKIIQKVLHEVELNNILKKTIRVKIPLEQIISHTVMYLIYFVTIVMALNQIGLATDILNIVLGGFMVVIILALFLSIKDFIPNFISGIFIHQKQFVKEGDIIQVKNIEGKITEINLIETLVQTKHGDTIYIPNSVLTKSEVIKIKRKRS